MDRFMGRIGACVLLWVLAAGGLGAQTANQPRMITTIAGTDFAFPAQPLPAVNAPLGAVTAVAVDHSGNLYLSDSGNHMVLRVDGNGTLSVIAGNGIARSSGDGGPAVSASLAAPGSLAIDGGGNVFLVDNGHVREITAAGVISTLPGLAGAYSIAADQANTLYVGGDSGVQKRTPDGAITVIAGTASLYPTAIAVDENGNIFMTSGAQPSGDGQDGIVREIAADGTITTVAHGLYYPKGLRVDAKGNIFVAEYLAGQTNSNRVLEITNGVASAIAGNGTLPLAGDGGPALNAAMAPVDVAVADNGTVYIADVYNSRVRAVQAGVITTAAGNGAFQFSGDQGPAASATFRGPTGVAVDAQGNLYIADTGNNRIRQVSPAGTTTTVAGNGVAAFRGDGGAATAASLSAPTGIAVDTAGNLYIADTGNNRVRKVNSAGVISTIAGNGSAVFFGGFGRYYLGPGFTDPSYSGDGGPAASAPLSAPSAVALDAAGNVFIAEVFRIRKVAPDGTITTVAGSGPGVCPPAPLPGYCGSFGGDGGPATKATLSAPNGVAVDGQGNLYIADSGNGRVREVTKDGVINTIVQTNVQTFDPHIPPIIRDLPLGVALDSSGGVYYSDVYNQNQNLFDTTLPTAAKVAVVMGSGSATIAGGGAQGYAGDGGLAAGAAFSNPAGIAFDAAGNLYIADTGNNRVREVLAAPPPFFVAPASLTFTGPAGGDNPPAQSLSLTSPTPGLAFTATTSAKWIGVDQASGPMPAVVQVSVNTSGLAVGTYVGSVAITIPATGAVILAAVKLTVFAVPTAIGRLPILQVTSPSITFTAAQGGPAATQSIQVTSTEGELPFTAGIATGGGQWLSLTAQSSVASDTAPATVSVTATPGTLATGTYGGVIVLSSGGQSIYIPVTLTVTGPAASIVLSQNALTFNAVAGGGMPLAQLFGILNTGGGSMPWTAAAMTLSGGNWLQLSTSAGTVARPLLDVSTVNAGVNTAGLQPGTYYGTIRISAANASNSPQALTVILNVLQPGTNLGPQIYPNGLIFTGVAGTSPGSEDVAVGNPSAAANSYLSSTIGPLTFIPGSATIQPNVPVTLHVSPDFSSLAPGITRGTIALQFSDGSPAQAINVLMSVAPATAPALVANARGKADPRLASCPPQALNVVLRAPQPARSFTATVGQSMTIEAAVSDACGNPVVGGSQQAKVVVLFSNGDQALPMTYLGNGIWQAAWPVGHAAQLVAVNVTATILQNATVVGGQASLTGSAVAPGPTNAAPLIGSVIHAASSVAGAPVSPGELIAIKGANLTNGAGANLPLPLPVSYGGTQVFFGTQALPIIYSSSGQMNVQAPFNLPVNAAYQLTVRNGNTVSVPQTVVIASVQPGIFTLSETGSGQGEIFKSDDVTPAQPGTPAAIGEMVVIYCTGLGDVSPAVQNGQSPPANPPAQTVNAVSVTIGGQAAKVLFSGLTPGSPGVYQINALVPAGVTPGDAVPVTISVGSETSPAGVTMAVR
jgi:uncharacterized protein (TIGR03437 family)